MRQEISLTAELVASIDRVEPEDGQEPDLTPVKDDEYSRLAGNVFRHLDGRPLLVFAYGSLIWNPEFDYDECEKARAYGWRRSFCLNLTTWRATPRQPGLMLALDYGGCCDGVLFRLSGHLREVQIERLLRRELAYTEDVRCTRWVTVHQGKDVRTALTFYAAPRGAGYIDLPIAEQARRMARAAGRAGTCASYLHNTIVKLQEHGIRDGYLWRLQKLVAAELRTWNRLA